jgi:hypothetical protein
MGNNGFYKKEITMKKISLLLIAIAITALNLDARTSRGKATKEKDVGAQIGASLGKSLTAFAGTTAKITTTMGTKLAEEAAHDAIDKNDKIADDVKETLKDTVSEGQKHIESTAHAVTDSAVTMANHSFDMLAGDLTEKEHEALIAEEAEKMTAAAGAAAGSLTKTLATAGGSIASSYATAAGNKASSKKVAAAEEALEEAQANLKSAQDLGSTSYIALAEQQIKDAEAALEVAKTPNKYLKQLADSGAQAAVALGDALGSFGKDVLAIVVEAESNRLLAVADAAWDEDEANALIEFGEDLDEARKSILSGDLVDEDKDEVLEELRSALVQFRDGTPGDDASGIDPDDEEKVGAVNAFIAEVDALENLDPSSEEASDGNLEAAEDALESAKAAINAAEQSIEKQQGGLSMSF